MTHTPEYSKREKEINKFENFMIFTGNILEVDRLIYLK